MQFQLVLCRSTTYCISVLSNWFLRERKNLYTKLPYRKEWNLWTYFDNDFDFFRVFNFKWMPFQMQNSTATKYIQFIRVMFTLYIWHVHARHTSNFQCFSREIFFSVLRSLKQSKNFQQSVCVQMKHFN